MELRLRRGRVARRRFRRRAAQGAAIISSAAGLYAGVAYLLLPRLLRHFEHHPALELAPKTTRTGEGAAGDPLNVAFVASEREILAAMLRAGWWPADHETLRTALRMMESVVRRRAYVGAPMSRLYLWGRPQDLAFEQPIGPDPARRHHVRFWHAPHLGKDGRPLFIGAATFDRGIGLNRRTGQVTHHIAPSIDSERDKLFGDLERAGQLTAIYQVTGIGPTLHGRNGGNDLYVTDGELTVGVVDNAAGPNPRRLPNPPLVRLKNQIWPWIAQVAL